MKGGTALEALAQVRTAIFDKTGTLTGGGADLIESRPRPAAATTRCWACSRRSNRRRIMPSRTLVLRIAREGALVLSPPQDVGSRRRP